jgi:trk system potassium uptake protein
MSLRKNILRAHPATFVLTGFLMAILAGTLLLKLEISTQIEPISWMDALFTATSAVCVTGLVVVDTGSFFSTFGQIVILVMIQIGGLGVMTTSVYLFRWLGRTISFRQRMAMQDLFTHTPREDIFSLIKSIVLFTLVAEVIGAILLTIHWTAELGFAGAVFSAVFHSVSAFCNAGFALYADSMMAYSDSILLNGVVGSLIILGGIGFPVLYDLQCRLRTPENRRYRLSIQTKTVLLTTAILVIGGALMFFLLESDAMFASPSAAHRILAPLFQSITCRTAGFNTVDIASLREATLAMMLFLMFFGASPGSCGGGVKTTTLALLAVFTATRIRRRHSVNFFKKTVPHETVTRCFSLVLVSFGIICAVLFLLLAADPIPGNETNAYPHTFLAYLFETVSAFGTVGLSMGLTPELGTWGKSWIIFMMIIGRVGVLTFSYIIVGTGTDNGITHAEENMMIG